MPKKKIVEASDVESESCQDSPPPQPAPKRARNAQSRVKGKKGALRRVLDLPVDLIWEICTHLDVQSLLALSNTNKSFRTVVTGEASKVLFKRARQRIGMPELLLPMPDLRYATLIYGKGCNICGKLNAGKVDPSFRARICGACLKNEFIELDMSESLETMKQLNRFTRYCSSYTTFKTGHESRYYLPSLQRISKDLDARFPITSRQVEAAQRRWEEDGSRDENAITVAGIRTSTETGEEMDANSRFVERLVWGSNGADAIPEGRFQTWFAEQQKETNLRGQDTEALRKWLKEMERQKAEANKQLRSGRREDVERRFEALGFDKAEFLSQDFKQHPQVKASRPLSDRTFTSTVEPVLRQVLESNRRRRIKWILREQYEQSVKNHFEKEYFPPASVYLQLPILQSVLDDVSQYPTEPLILPPQIKPVASKEIFDLIRQRRGKLLRSIVNAYFDLANEMEKKQKDKEQEKEEEEDNEVENFSPTGFTSLDQLPLTLRRLPPGIPRSDDEPILAPDEQVISFLDHSPLARFECIECHQLYTTRDLLAHQAYGRGCASSLIRSWSQSGDEWMLVEGIDDVENPRIRINKDVLSLSLKLQQLIKATPLVIQDESKQLPDLGAGYSMGQEEDAWYNVALHCDCEYEPVRRSVNTIYAHLVKTQTHCRVKSSVAYSKGCIDRWRKLRESKHAETGEYVEAECVPAPTPKIRLFGISFGSSDEDEHSGLEEEKEDYTFV
ncbi:hypothetical protein JCM5350_005171 [Sporobolomyces pararoseus]